MKARLKHKNKGVPTQLSTSKKNKTTRRSIGPKLGPETHPKTKAGRTATDPNMSKHASKLTPWRVLFDVRRRLENSVLVFGDGAEHEWIDELTSSTHPAHVAAGIGKTWLARGPRPRSADPRERSGAPW